MSEDSSPPASPIPLPPAVHDVLNVLYLDDDLNQLANTIYYNDISPFDKLPWVYIQLAASGQFQMEYGECVYYDGSSTYDCHAESIKWWPWQRLLQLRRVMPGWAALIPDSEHHPFAPTSFSIVLDPYLERGAATVIQRWWLRIFWNPRHPVGQRVFFKRMEDDGVAYSPDPKRRRIK